MCPTCGTHFVFSHVRKVDLCMIYTIDPTSDEPIMLINKHIGFDETDGMGIDGALFQTELLQLDRLGKKRIQIWINSPGGIVLDGYNIVSAILKTQTPVDTINVGIAASIAGVIFMAGRKRIMMDYSKFMTHPTSGSEDKKSSDAISSSLVSIMAAKSSISESDMKFLMDRTTWLNAAECFSKGFCTEIEVTREANVKRMPVSDAKAMWKESSLILNSILNNSQNNNTMSLTKVTMRLKLNDSAPETDIVAAIDSIENRAITAEGKVTELTTEIQNKEKTSKKDMDKLKADMDDLQAKLDAKKKEFDDCKAKLDAMETDKKTAEENAATEKAKNMVEGFAKAGRIKNDASTILKWTNLAKANFDETKLMIEELPLNKVADKITIGVPNKLEAGALPTTALGLAVKNKLKREGKA